MTKPLTFEEYWDRVVTRMNPETTDSKIFPYLKGITENTWNAAMLEATLICNNKDKEYEDSAIIDKDVILDIAVEIESLKSE